MLKKFQTIKNPPMLEDFDTLFYKYYTNLLFWCKYACIDIKRTFAIFGHNLV